MPTNECKTSASWAPQFNPLATHAVPGGHRIYKIISLGIGIPMIVAGTISVFVMSEEKERPPFIPYTYLRIRNKKFPWGDGDRSFFHNPRRNALSGGYEEQDE